MPVSRAAATPAQESAQMMMKLFDQSKTVRRPFKDEDDTLPPDGVLDRGEFPSARFDMVDRLELSDGRITEAELAKALAKMDTDTQARLLKRTQETYHRAEGLGKRFGLAFGGFALGGLALAGGLVLGGPVGLGLAGLGALGIGGGFFTAVKTIFDGGKNAGALFKDVDAALGKLQA
jgi:hypothetical protein